MYSLATLLDMGEYGYFVWLSYGIFCIVLISLMIESKCSLKRAIKHFDSLSSEKAKKSPGKEAEQ
jgi:heme exporter protein CcmD